MGGTEGRAGCPPGLGQRQEMLLGKILGTLRMEVQVWDLDCLDT